MRLITAASLLALLALAGCSDRNAKVREVFMSGCLQSGATTAVCRCIFKHVEQAYSPDQLDALNLPAYTLTSSAARMFAADSLRFAAMCIP
ncbi:hypothetical protein QZM76_25195 [Burkholderia multivorans]|nr:hypothetical protein [Burkholderia multivorans]